MNPFKKLADKLARPSEAAPATGRPPPVPSVMKMPDGLMEELFPQREVMVSVIFGGANDAGAPLPSSTALPPALPKPEPQPQGMTPTPEVLSISDELRAAIFPTEKVMVSVIFQENAPKPPVPGPTRRHWTDDDADVGDESSRRHDFPIV